MLEPRALLSAVTAVDDSYIQGMGSEIWVNQTRGVLLNDTGGVAPLTAELVTRPPKAR